MKLSIIIPVFNEEKTIADIVRKISRVHLPNLEKEIIVVNDGSQDQTGAILEELKKEIDFILVSCAKNLGKGAAIKTALKYVTGDFILIQDADLEYDPTDYKILLGALSRNSPVIYGSRNLGRTNRGYFLLFLGGKLLTAVLNILFDSNLTDINTGYKLFRTDVLKSINLEAKGFDFCEEVTVKILKSGYPIKEVPIHYNPRKYSEGKKIRFRDGLIGLWTIIKLKIFS